jgi:hypothetical protein
MERRKGSCKSVLREPQSSLKTGSIDALPRSCATQVASVGASSFRRSSVRRSFAVVSAGQLDPHLCSAAAS